MLNSSRPAVEPPRRARGFTLVELVVTVAVGLLLIVFLFQIFNASLGAWRQGESQNDTYREARAALQLMTRDLSQITAPMPGGAAPVLVLDHYPGSTPAPQAGDEINEELYCLPIVPNGGVSNLCAAGYFCLWMPDLISDTDPNANLKRAHAPRAFALMRQFLGSGRVGAPGLFERFQAVGGKPVLSFLDLYERTPPTLASDPQKPVAVATELCAYVWDLQFRTPATLQARPATPVYGSLPPYPAALPAFVEIRFKALSAEAARQLEGNAGVYRSTWGDPSPGNTLYQRIIQPGTRQFVARVPIYSGSAATPSP